VFYAEDIGVDADDIVYASKLLAYDGCERIVIRTGLSAELLRAKDAD
jgi:hypothetical protein